MIAGGVLIVGCARDIAKYVDHVVAQMHKIGRLFAHYRIVVYENDSADETEALLRRYENVSFSVISETNVAGPRTVRLAHGRNTLLRVARQSADEFEWFIVMDMDFENNIKMRGIVRAVDSWSSLRWNVCTAVTRIYYDYWALRLPGVMNYDCWTDKSKMDRYGACSKYKWRPRKVTWVVSAFNGIAIHRMDAVASTQCEYDGQHAMGQETCEHVSFYTGIGRVIIHPALVAQVHTNDRSRNRVAAVIAAFVVVATLFIVYTRAGAGGAHRYA